MNFITRLFSKNNIECPRCLGKGEVDNDDIIRLKKELYWLPGKCAYCNGQGKVSKKQIEKTRTDLEYLTTDINHTERIKVISNDEEALKRADTFKADQQTLFEEIRLRYYIDNLEPDEIADFLSRKYGRQAFPYSQKEETITFIEKVVRTKD